MSHLDETVDDRFAFFSRDEVLEQCLLLKNELVVMGGGVDGLLRRNRDISFDVDGHQKRPSPGRGGAEAGKALA